MQNFFVALIAFFLISCAIFAQSDASVGAWGGNITAANISMLQDSDRWHVFWGVEDSSSNDTLISISAQMVSRISNQTRHLSFPSTYQYYVISQSSNIDSSSYSVPTHSEIDSLLGLFGVESSTHIFSNSSTFSVKTTSGYEDVQLPTLFLPGLDANGSLEPQAFSQGAILLGGELAFLVQKSDFFAIDGSYIDYQFVLPYDISSTNTYHLFSINPPSSPDTGGYPTISYTWDYDGSHLTIKTESQASILLRDELGASYSATADENGEYKFMAPAGYRYYITVSNKDFYRLVAESTFLSQQ